MGPLQSITTPTLRLSDLDLDFVLEQVTEGKGSSDSFRELLQDDEAFRSGLVGDPRVFSRLMDDDEAFLRVSPALFFEVLLRRARSELEKATHTMERTGKQAVPVFDAHNVVALLDQPRVVYYLADMLASFTRVRSGVTRVRVRRGLWRKVRYSDMDVDGLVKYGAALEEEQRFPVYKRIGDVSLFILGVFPGHAPTAHGRASLSESRPQGSGRARRGAEEYEEDGRRFYRLAAEHPSAGEFNVSEVLHTLHDHFSVARKPLTFIAEHYLQGMKRRVFTGDQE